MDAPKMFDAFKLFDAYGLRAQLFPALIAGLPTLGLLIVLVPWDRIGFPHAFAASMSAILMFAFADLARKYGRKVETKLGTRSTPQLFHRGNPAIEEPIKDRYRDFLASRLGVKAPTEQDERQDIAKANQFYGAGATWLRDQTRDTKKFKILFNELVTYGFRRNLLGLKYISLALNMLVLGAGAAILYFRWPYFASINDIDVKIWTVIGVAVAHSLYMAFGVNKWSVIEASAAYGRQLILSCEALIDRAPASKPKRTKATKEQS